MRLTGALGIGIVAALSGLALAAAPFDRQAPTLTATPPAGPVRGTVDLGILADDPRGVTLRVQLDDGEPVVVDPGWTLDTTTLADGPHTLRVVATDHAWRRNAAEVELALRVDNTAPVLAVHVTPAAQGRTTAIFVATSEAATVEASIRQLEPMMHPVGELRWRGLVGFSIEQDPGAVPLVVTATDEAGNVARHERELVIEPTTFASGGYVTISPQVDRERRDTRLVERMFAQRDAAFRADLPAQFWTGPMVRPVAGRETSSFGKYRTFSDGQKSHHNGIDIAAPTGTPVLASADGVVTFAGQQPIYGNVVIVGHGHGVATSYNHLDSISVAVGQRVEAGQRIGRVGSTGNSTGPHLHWGLTVNGVHVDAAQWTKDAFTLDTAGASRDPS